MERSYLDILFQQVDAQNKRFGKDDPFKIVTRLSEETGEVAKAVNHMEMIGAKVEKHGSPDKIEVAKEIADVLRAALSLARYYSVEAELYEVIDNMSNRLESMGYLASPKN